MKNAVNTLSLAVGDFVYEKSKPVCSNSADAVIFAIDTFLDRIQQADELLEQQDIGIVGNGPARKLPDRPLGRMPAVGLVLAMPV